MKFEDPFNDDSTNLTFGKIFDCAIAIENLEDAKRFLDAYVDYMLEDAPEYSREDAYKVARENLGYLAGYYGKKEQDKIRRLYLAPHPILEGTGTSKDAFLKGIQDRKIKSRIEPKIKRRSGIEENKK